MRPIIQNRGILNPTSNWLQSSSDNDSDPDFDQFVQNTEDMDSEDAWSPCSSPVNENNMGEFESNDMYIDDDILINPRARIPAPDSPTNAISVANDFDLDHYFLDPEGLNLVNPFPNSQEIEYDQDLEHFLLAPNGEYLDNQGMSESDSDNDLAFELDPEPPPGPVDPG